MFDDHDGVIPDLVSQAGKRHREIDLFSGVEEALVKATRLHPGGPAYGVSSADEVPARTAAGGVPGPAPEGILAGVSDAPRPNDAERHRPQTRIGSEPLYGLIEVGPGRKDGVIIEEYEDVSGALAREQIPACGYPNILNQTEEAAAGRRLDGRIGRHVEEQQLVEMEAGGRLDGSLKLSRSVVADDAE